jgi:hypothetical protein
MRRSFLRYTHAFLLPLLAVGLILTGCDSSGSDSGPDTGGPDISGETFAGDASNNDLNTSEAITQSLLTADLKNQTDRPSDFSSKSDFEKRYQGNTLAGTKILITDRGALSDAKQTQYDDEGLTPSTKLSDLDGLDDGLIESAALESEDSPNSGSQVTADALIDYYFGKLANQNNVRTANGVNMSQLVNKLLLGAALYERGAEALNDADGVEDVDKALGYIGMPRQLNEFLDYENGEGGLSATAKSTDGDTEIDLRSEFVHTWAGYIAERSAATQENTPQDYARTAFAKLQEARQKFADDNDDAAETAASEALDEWEKVVAINVIHYVNSMKSDLEPLSDDDRITQQKLIDNTPSDADETLDKAFEEHWGEAKPFAWALQFNDDRNSNLDLTKLHEELGPNPPYTANRDNVNGEAFTKEDAVDEIEAVKAEIQQAYGFAEDNVDNW